MSNPTHGTCNENYVQVFLAHELGNISIVRAASRRSCNHLSLRVVKMQGACATTDMGSNAVGSRGMASSPSDCDSPPLTLLPTSGRRSWRRKVRMLAVVARGPQCISPTSHLFGVSPAPNLKLPRRTRLQRRSVFIRFRRACRPDGALCMCALRPI